MNVTCGGGKLTKDLMRLCKTLSKIIVGFAFLCGANIAHVECW